MQQLIVLASADGVIDMTPQAIAATTSIPLDIIKKGLSKLEEVDPYTRTPGEDGRRIILLDEHRPWGWLLVNHGKYKHMRDMAQKREADRVRINEKRNRNKTVAIVSRDVANVAHTDTDTDTDTKELVKPVAQSAPQAPNPIVMSLPLRDGTDYEVRLALVSELEPLYPHVDIPATLREMKGWLVLNAERRKTKRGVRKFIGTWLQGEEEKHGG